MSSNDLDLDRRTRDVLDFDELLAWLTRFARTEPGRARVLATSPSADAERVESTLAALREMQRHLEGEGAIVPSGLADPLQALAGLRTPGRALEATSLQGLAAVSSAMAELGLYLRRLPDETFARLRAHGQALPDLRAESEPVLRHVAPDGTIADEASHELGRLRRSRARTGERLRRMLQSFLRRADAQVVIRDDFITQRNGRFVIPVRSDAPHAVQGIVHASSSSGASRFVEPFETVDLNNELVRLADAEERETERLLASWSEAFRTRLDDVERGVAVLAELDGLQARALFGAEVGGVLPSFERAAELRLENLRHPLLDRRLREAGRRSVAMSIVLDPFDRVLVLSGPNAGGKTVALKTAGLAVLMAQAAIPLPADRVCLPTFLQVRADVGDHQSMLADLSTFTAHVASLVSFLQGARPPVLLLLDEIGSGTDPAEGAALACSVLESLRRPGFTVLATTHQGAVKAWAATTEGALSAALEFDTVELKPTYRVIAGAAGVSAGLEIARRAGLDPGIVDDARSRLGEEGGRVEEFLDRLHEMRRALETAQDELAAQRQSLEAERREAARRLDEELARAHRDSERRLGAAIAEYRGSADRALARIDDARVRARAEQRLDAAAERARRAVAAPVSSAQAAAGPPLPDRLEPGMRVRVLSLDRDGAIERVTEESVLVRVGPMAVSVGPDDLGPPRDPQAGSVAARRAPRVRSLAARPGADALDREAPSELVLIGKTVDEALELLDKFLDDAAVEGLAEVRVVHGHGTGKLRRAVRGFLAGHLHVLRHRAGAPNEGGDGATIVTLR